MRPGSIASRARPDIILGAGDYAGKMLRFR
jgi:hypothetical protein